MSRIQALKKSPFRWLSLYFLLISATSVVLPSPIAHANAGNRQARAERRQIRDSARIFTQDRHRICRRIPDSFRLDDPDFAQSLLRASTQAMFEVTQTLLRQSQISTPSLPKPPQEHVDSVS